MRSITGASESGNRDYDDSGAPITSSTGAKYRMQVQPETAAKPGHGIKPAQSDSPAEFNRVGQQLLSALSSKYKGDNAKTWAAYNAGEGNLDKALADAAKNGGSWMDALAKYQSPENHAQTVAYVGKNMAALGGWGGAQSGLRGTMGAGAGSIQPAVFNQAGRNGLRGDPYARDENGNFKDPNLVEIIRGMNSSVQRVGGAEDRSASEIAQDNLKYDLMNNKQDGLTSHAEDGKGGFHDTYKSAADGLTDTLSALSRNRVAEQQQAMVAEEHQRNQRNTEINQQRLQEEADRKRTREVQQDHDAASKQLQTDLEAMNTVQGPNGPTFDANEVGKQRQAMERGLASLGGKSYADLSQENKQRLLDATHLMYKVAKDADGWNPLTPGYTGTDDPTQFIGLKRLPNGDAQMRNGVVIPKRYINKVNVGAIAGRDGTGGETTDRYNSLFAK